jgi:hypothetical protein
MSQPRFIEIDGRRHLCRELVELRRAQLAHWRAAQQPALFELRLDRRPPAERTGRDRYLEPGLFDR